MSRRVFLGSTIAVGGMALAGCTIGGHPAGPHSHDETLVPRELRFLREDEARTLEAFIARLIPGGADDPGAREAGVLYYIDNLLTEHVAFAQPTYLGRPFARTPDESATSANEIVVAEDQLYRYGLQSDVLPRELYRSGLASLNAFASGSFGAPFADLDEQTQDAVLMVLDDIQQASEGGAGEQSGGGSGNDSGSGGGGSDSDDALSRAAGAAFGDVDPGGFFARVRTDTIEGMFADPVYGGNRDMVGWRLIGYPGSQRAWSPEQMMLGAPRRPQPIDDLVPMNPDRRGEAPIDALEKPYEGVADG